MHYTLFLAAFGIATVNASPAGKACPAEIQRDVLIVGGGGAGAYAAVRLRDAKKSVAVVEISNKLGGHIDTFYDPSTKAPIDYGVQAYIPSNETTNFFARFGVTLQTVPQSPFASVVADFKTGAILKGATAPNLTALAGPLAQYAQTAAQFTSLASGAYDLPSEVPADLLLPFGQYVAKYGLADSLPLVWTFAQGVGNLLEATTLYVLQNFGLPHILGLQAGYQYAPAGNQVVYDQAAKFLGKDVLYSSVITTCTRTAKGIKAVVKTPNGNIVIKAKKLLITIPPTIKNLQPFDLDEAEKSLFSQWSDVPYYVGLVSGSSLPPLTNFLNVDPTTPDNLPRTPLVWRLETVGVPGYQTVKVIGEANSNAARNLVKKAVHGIENSLNVTSSRPKVEPWEQHKDLGLHVSPQAIQAGFYSKLYALQGQKSTYYAGNAWCSDYSPLIWGFLEQRILPRL